MVQALEFIAVFTARCFYVVQKQKGVADAMIKASHWKELSATLAVAQAHPTINPH